MAESSCSHSKLDDYNQCLRCGARFVQVWHELKAITYTPLIVSALAAGVFLALLLGLFGPSQAHTGKLLLMIVFAYFSLRATRGLLDLLFPHATHGGKVRVINRRPIWSPFSTKDAQVRVGTKRFSLNEEAVRILNENETVLLEYLRWSRTVLAIYKSARR